MQRADREAERLFALLERERRVLVTGHLQELEKLGAAKAAMLARLSRRAERPAPAVLKRLRARAAANQRLYEAALAGIRKVRDQIGAMVAGGGAELRTYAPDGGRQALAPGKGRLERRA